MLKTQQQFKFQS